MVRCSNEVEGDAPHDSYPLTVTVMGAASTGADGALCMACLAAALVPGPLTPSVPGDGAD